MTNRKLGDPGHGLRGRARDQPRHHDRQRRPADHLAGARRRHPRSCSGSSTATTWPSPRWCSPPAAFRPLRPPARPDRRAARLRRRQRRRRAGQRSAARWSPPAFAMGAFAALIFPTTLSIISNTFPERRERAAALGRLGRRRRPRRRRRPGHRRAAARALLLGQRLLGAGPAGAGRRPVAAVRPRARVARPVGARRSTCPGSSLSVAMLATLTYTIIEAPAHGWTSPATARRLRARGRAARAFVRRASAGRRTRCSTCRCSATAGSAPPAAR